MNKTVKYLLFPDGSRLVSWTLHDYKRKDFDGKSYSIDSGQDSMFSRVQNVDDKVVYTTETIEDAIGWIREEFTWLSLLKADGNARKFPIKRKLKNLSDNHLGQLINWVDEESFTHSIFIAEINYRKNEKRR